MNMKKLIAMLMTLMMVLALAACGSNDTPAANNGGNNGDNAAPTYANALEKIKGEGRAACGAQPRFLPDGICGFQQDRPGTVCWL